MIISNRIRQLSNYAYFSTSPARITSQQQTTFRIIYSAIKIREGDRQAVSSLYRNFSLDWNFSYEISTFDLHE